MLEPDTLENISHWMAQTVVFAAFATVIYMCVRMILFTNYRSNDKLNYDLEASIKRKTSIDPKSTFHIENIWHNNRD